MSFRAFCWSIAMCALVWLVILYVNVKGTP
jgi:hypothetical protein